MPPPGGLSRDDSLLTRYGQHFDTMASLDDSAQQGEVWAHDLVHLRGRDGQTYDPIDFRYTQPAFCRFLDKTVQVPSVGTLAHANLVVLKQEQQRLDAFDAHLQQEHRQTIEEGGQPVLRKLSITYIG
jgi:hypothetical protein